MRSLIFSLLLLPTLGCGLAAAADFSPTIVIAPPTSDLACAGAGALSRIQSRFGWAERTEWHRGYTIERIGNPRSSRHPYSEPGQVLRDFCMADAVMTDGSEHPVFYVIEHGLGFVGLGSNVDFCVPGLDPWHVHDGDCRTVR